MTNNLLTIEQQVDIIQKQTKLYKFLLAHPELQDYQIKLHDTMVHMTPIQRCVYLNTIMQEKRIKLEDKFKEINTLSNYVLEQVEEIKTNINEVLDGRDKNTD